MKKSFMTRALAMGLSLAMAFSMSAATNVTTAAAAAKPAMKSSKMTVKVGQTKGYNATAATQKAYKITKYKVSKANKNKATITIKSNKKGIKVTGEKAVSKMSVRIYFKNNKTKKTTSKVSTLKVKAVDEKLTMTAAPTGVKKITVTFNKAVDTTKAVLTVKKGSATLVTNGVTYAADNKSAEIAVGSKITLGTYTVELSGLKEALTASFEAEDEKLTRFALVNNYLVADADATTKASISYKALNQYDEMMAPNNLNVSCSFSSDIDYTTKVASAKKAGTVYVNDITPTLAIPNQTGTIVIVDTATGVNMNETITYQSKAVAATGEFVGVYNDKTERIMDTNLKKGDKTAEFFLLFTFKDQYDGAMDAERASKSGISLNPAAVATDLIVNKDVDGNAKDITIDGKDYVKIPLGTSTANGVITDQDKIATAGSLTLTVVSKYKGVLATPKIVVEEPAIASSISLGNNEFYEGKKIDLKLEVTDANGNAITDYDALKKTEIKVDPTLGGTVSLNKNSDGTGSYVWDIPTTAVDNKDEKRKNTAYGTLTVYANAATSGKYMVKSFNVTVKEQPEVWEVTGTTAKTVTSVASGSSLTVDLSTLTYADQYGNEMKFKDVTADAIQYKIVSDGTTALTVTGSNTKMDEVSTASALTDDKKIELKAGNTKGSAKLYLRISNPVVKKADKDLDSNNYDIAIDLNVVDGKSVDDTSEVRIDSINDGKDVWGSTADKIQFVPSLTAKAAGHTTSVAVVVKAKVGSKTIVVDPSQYSITDDTIDGLKVANTVTNPAVSKTKELRVVVNTDSNETVVVTGAYILSNADSVVKSIESTDAAEVTSANLTFDFNNISKSIKAKDQYGADVTETVSNSVIYYVKPTGEHADKVTIVNNNNANISITVTSAGITDSKLTADVTYKKGDVTYTKEGVTFKINQ